MNQAFAYGGARHAGWAAAEAPAPPTTPASDRTTRHLMVAAHIDQEFSARVAKEYLSQPLRSLPPPSGFDSAAVLREAVAAQTRRRIRDWTVVALFAPLLFTGAWLVGGWLVTALAVRLSRRRPDRLTASALLTLWAFSLPIGVIVVLADQAGIVEFWWTAPSIIANVLLGSAIFATLFCDRLVEWWIVTRSFPRFAGSVRRTWPGEARIRALGIPRYQDKIARVVRHDGGSNVVVFRGGRPFVGAGRIAMARSFALPLVPAEPEESENGKPVPGRRTATATVGRFMPTDLYNHLHAEYEKLRTSSSLGPSRRLRDHDVKHHVAVAAREMLDNAAHPRFSWILPGPKQPPVATLSLPQLTEAANQPVEWMRYYQQIQVESWDRELVVSLFLHVGCDDRMLYIEWTCCVLNPVDNTYRDVEPSRKPWRAALSDLVALPLTACQRARVAATRIDADKFPEHVTAGTYGIGSSIRELAADDDASSYFERADVDRYCAILVQHMSAGIAGFLTSRGISVREFMARVTQIIDRSVNNYGINTGTMGQDGATSPAQLKGDPDKK